MLSGLTSEHEFRACSQDTGLGGDKPALRARHPARRLPEPPDAGHHSPRVCSRQVLTVSFRCQPGMGVHGLPPFGVLVAFLTSGDWVMGGY